MIAVFPHHYPDELLYSLLARYYVRSGAITYLHCFGDLFSKKTRPDIEYLNEMTEDLLSHLPDMDEMVLEHTMFPVLLFLPSEKKKEAYESLARMDNRYQDLVYKPKERRYLYYCKKCAAEDRDRYGEAYWHRIPQIRGITVCPVHHCYLTKTDIPIYSKEAGSLLPAEAYISENSMTECCENEYECTVSDYAADLFSGEFAFADSNVGEILRQHTSKFRSPSGKSIRSKKLFEEYQRRFPNGGITEGWQIRKIFNGYRFDLVEICQLMVLLGVKPEDLHCNDVYEPTKESHHNNGRFRTYETDWGNLDIQYLPCVERSIKEIRSSPKPVRITAGYIARKVGIPYSTLERGYLVQCSSLIDSYAESQEEFWARKLQWAYQEIRSKCLPLHKTQLRKFTNINFEEMKRVLPLLDNAELIEAISQ